MHSPIPFAQAIPDRIIWVSPDGNDGNSGSRDAPLQSIQLAIDRATPGTAILLKPGQYSGNFEFEKIQGTAEKPIWLAAADGPGTAIITAASNSASVITIQGEDNLVIKHLTIIGGANGIQVSQSGHNYTNLVHNVVIDGNTIVDTVGDGIKVSQAVNAHAVNNIVDGAGGEGIDFVGVVDGEITGNEISNVTGSSAGLFAKGGSSDILIANNYIHDVVGDGLLVGGWTSAGNFLPGTDYEARNIEVTGNVVANAGRRPLGVLGAEDVDIHDNFFASLESNDYVVVVGSGSPQVSPPPPSSNVSIHDNVFDRSAQFARVEAGSTGIVFANNIKNGVIDGDMRLSPPELAEAFTEVWPDGLLDAFVWATSARSARTISGTSAADDLTGTSGNDYLRGGESADTMSGGRGDDGYEITTWHDVIVENPGQGIDRAHVYSDSYTLAANVENLIVKTGAGGTFAGNALNNIMVGGSGNETLVGGPGNDLFVFAPGRGHDTITDFAEGPASRDTIDLTQFTALGSLTDVLALASQVSANTVISFATGEKLTLANVARGGLTTDDFLLARAATAPNAPPTSLMLSDNWIAEATPVGAAVSVLSASDPDSGEVFTYSLSDDANGTFTLSGDKLVLARPLDFESAHDYAVTIQVRDSGNNVLERTFTIAVTNAPPVAPADAQAAVDAVVEGAANGSSVGIVASATDVNGGAVTYALADDAGGRFAINPLTGRVTVANGALLDHEAASEHTIVVRAGDGVLWSTTRAFTIAVTDIGGATIKGTRFADRIDATHTLNGQLPTQEADGVTGRAGNDVIATLGGDDAVSGGSGADKMSGGTGNDSYTVDNSGDLVIERPGEGSDIVKSAVSQTLTANVEQLWLIGTAAISGIGNDLDNLIKGNAGDNVLSGGAGIDTVSYAGASAGVSVNLANTKAQNTGGGRNDTLTGFENLTGSNFDDTLGGSNDSSGSNVIAGLNGDDALSGRNGNDVLIGGGGSDTLTGGNGADAFAFDLPSAGVDRITDFVSGSDVLQISAAGFGGGLSAGEQAEIRNIAEVGDAAGAGTDGYFILDNAGTNIGLLYWDPTGGAGDDAVAFVKLQGVTSLASTDLVLV